jgi:hypothetical protein
MGRPERHDVDYFPFLVKEGRTLYVLESKYGCTGTGFFTNVLRFLARTPDHHFCIKHPGDRLWFFSKLYCDEEAGIEMLNMMADTGKIDPHLWRKKQVIASEDFLNSISDAYRKRNNNCITIDDIREHYRLNDRVNTHTTELTAEETTDEPNLTNISSNNNPQTKVKYSKVKEKKEYGEFQNVKLTLAEHSKLIEKFGEPKLGDMIETLSSAIASKGYRYKSHYATILNWSKRPQYRGNGHGKQANSDRVFEEFLHGVSEGSGQESS